MKTPYLQIDTEDLAVGLRAENYQARNKKTGLRTATNMYATVEGLVEFERISALWSALPETASWPHPQLFRSCNKFFLAYDTSIYAFDEDSVPTSSAEWAAVKLAIKLYTDTDTAYTIAASDEPWHFVDLGEAWLFIRDDVVIFKMMLSRMHVAAGPLGHTEDYNLACPDRTIYSGCTCNGRVIFGGFDSSDLFGDAQWLELWNTYWGSIPESLAPVSNLLNVDKNWVMWSTVGGGADAWMFFYPELVIDGVLKDFEGGGNTRPPFFDLLKRNELGFSPMSWSGQILAVKPIGNKGDFVVYGENGISLMQQFFEPVPSFGETVLLKNDGIASRGAVGGDISEHICLTTSGELCRLRAGEGLTRLGYTAEFSSHVDNELRFGFDDIQRRHFICANDSDVFVLSPTGLTQVSGQTGITSCMVVDGSLIGVADTVDDTTTIITTDYFDMGNRGIKNLIAVEAGLTINEDATMAVTVQAKYDADTTFSKGPYTMNAQGLVHTGVCGVDFYITITITKGGTTYESYEGFKLDYIKLHYQQEDKRAMRGVRVS